MRIALVSTIALACAACAAEPAAPVAGPAAPRVWQQFCEQASSVPHASSLAASRGAEGWELVAMYNGVLCYKRPASEALREVHREPRAPASPQARDPGF